MTFRDYLDYLNEGTIITLKDIKVGQWIVYPSYDGEYEKSSGYKVIYVNYEGTEFEIQAMQYRKREDRRIDFANIMDRKHPSLILTDKEFKQLGADKFNALKYIKAEATKLGIDFKKITFNKKVSASRGWTNVRGGYKHAQYKSVITITSEVGIDSSTRNELKRAVEDTIAKELFPHTSLNGIRLSVENKGL